MIIYEHIWPYTFLGNENSQNRNSSDGVSRTHRNDSLTYLNNHKEPGIVKAYHGLVIRGLGGDQIMCLWSETELDSIHRKLLATGERSTIEISVPVPICRVSPAWLERFRMSMATSWKWPSPWKGTKRSMTCQVLCPVLNRNMAIGDHQTPNKHHQHAHTYTHTNTFITAILCSTQKTSPMLCPWST